jgi:hypothetical protein
VASPRKTAAVRRANWAKVVGSIPNQELLMRHGIRIGESYALDELARDGVYEFAFIVTPQFVEGATAGNTPPAALGQPRRTARGRSRTIRPPHVRPEAEELLCTREFWCT